MTLIPPLRLAVLAALLVLAALAALLLVTGPGDGASAPSTGEPAAVLRPAAKPSAQARPAKPRRRLAPDLAFQLQATLARRGVVVVALHASGDVVDREVVAEARAGAAAAGAGFRAVNVANEKHARAVARLLGTGVGAPAVAVLRRPRSIFLRLDGFTDRGTVEQAAVSARP